MTSDSVTTNGNERHSLADHFARAGPRTGVKPQRRSRFVNGLKLSLLLAAAALTAVVAVLVSGDKDTGIPLEFSRITGLGGDKQTMHDPRFVGTDKHGRPYTLTADSATQDARNQRLILLNNLRAEMRKDEDQEMRAHSRQALFNQEKMTLVLLGPVTFWTSMGYELETKGAIIDLKQNTAQSTAPISGLGPMGQIDAQQMRVEQNGERVFFEKRVRVIITDTGDAK